MSSGALMINANDCCNHLANAIMLEESCRWSSECHLSYVRADSEYMISRWTREHIAAIGARPLPSPPLIDAVQALPLFPQCDLWDIWPVQNTDGSIAKIADGMLWMILSAPRHENPDMRHDFARIRLLFHSNNTWRDCGLLFPDDLNPGSREWSGSARYNAGSNSVTAYFTAAGRRGEIARSFEQRLFQTTGCVDLSGATPAIVEWSEAEPLVVNDGTLYADLAKEQGVPGSLRGFRDPYYFCDPADDGEYIFFTGSQPRSTHACSGVIGIARAAIGGDGTGFTLLPPVVSADGVANEMERPHMLCHNGLYYLFWSTQNSVFAPEGPKGPTGLYGMVGPSVTGSFEPLNGTGLVIANPATEPRQAYCWQVLDTLEVVSFIDHWGLKGRDPFADPDVNRAQFGGTIAPMLKIEIDGNVTKLLGLA